MERKAYAVSDDLTKVTVKVYKDSGHSQLAASVQTLLQCMTLTKRRIS